MRGSVVTRSVPARVWYYSMVCHTERFPSAIVDVLQESGAVEFSVSMARGLYHDSWGSSPRRVLYNDTNSGVFVCGHACLWVGEVWGQVTWNLSVSHHTRTSVRRLPLAAPPPPCFVCAHGRLGGRVPQTQKARW